MQPNRSLVICALASLALSCSPDGGSGPGSTGDGTSTTLGPPGNPGTTAASTGTSGAQTSAPPIADSSSTGDDTNGSNIIPRPDGQVNNFDCDIFGQDCPRGEKCSAYSVLPGGNEFSGTHCVPIADNPGAPDEPCMVQRNIWTGLDDCELGSMCWYVDPKTLEGRCIPLCSPPEEAPTCIDPTRSCDITAQGFPLLCLTLCHPLAQDCVPGDVCVDTGADFHCVRQTDGGGGGAPGDPCQWMAECDPGAACIDSSNFSRCDDTSCCSPFCTVGDATPCLAGQQCVPYHAKGSAPVGFEDLGLCAVQ